MIRTTASMNVILLLSVLFLSFGHPHGFEAGVVCDVLVPNAFTPNNDGVNDEFFVKTLQGCEVRQYRIEIFDQYGRVVYKSKDLLARWDGTYDGMPLNPGTYFWKINVAFEGQNESERRGSVLVIK